MFISPFILLFAASVFYLNHGKLILAHDTPAETYRDLTIPDGFDRLKGREAVERAQADPSASGRERRNRISPLRPKRSPSDFSGLEGGLARRPSTSISTRRTATVKRRAMGMWESISYLHKIPGPHNVAIRGNWVGTQAWRVIADATIYLLLFISLSGIYLWWAIKAERRIGLALLACGRRHILRAHLRDSSW